MNSSTRRVVLIVATMILLLAATIWALAPGRVDAQCYFNEEPIACDAPGPAPR